MSKTFFDITSNFINRIFVAIINLTAIPFLLKNLGEFQFGVFSLFNITIMLLMIFDFGLSKSGVRFITLYNGKTKDGEIFSTLFILTIITSFLLLTLGYLLHPLIIDLFDLKSRINNKIIYFLCLFIAIMFIYRGFFISVLYSYQKFKIYNWINIFIEIIRWSGTVYASYGNNALLNIFIIQAATYFFHNLILFFYSIKIILINRAKISLNFDRQIGKEIINYSF